LALTVGLQRPRFLQRKLRVHVAFGVLGVVVNVTPPLLVLVDGHTKVLPPFNYFHLVSEECVFHLQMLTFVGCPDDCSHCTLFWAEAHLPFLFPCFQQYDVLLELVSIDLRASTVPWGTPDNISSGDEV
jgi:hypothetical protein